MRELFPDISPCETEICAVTERSDLAKENTLFVCIRGALKDGHDFAPTAYAQGCRAFVAETKLRQQAVARLAEKYGAPLIHTQQLLDNAMADNAPEYWTVDGVHPTPAGHHIIAQAWLKAFAEIDD